VKVGFDIEVVKSLEPGKLRDPGKLGASSL
jgi:hypothetical protein